MRRRLDDSDEDPLLSAIEASSSEMTVTSLDDREDGIKQAALSGMIRAQALGSKPQGEPPAGLKTLKSPLRSPVWTYKCWTMWHASSSA